MALAVLPRRDADARGLLADLGRSARPVTLTCDRTVTVPGELGSLLPGGGITRGAVVEVAGGRGSGATALAFELAAAVTAAGEWAVAIDLEGSLGMLAAHEAGVVLERMAVVRGVAPERWGTVTAALIDGFTLVIADVPPRVPAVVARRLVARVRERGVVLAVCTAETRGDGRSAPP